MNNTLCQRCLCQRVWKPTQRMLSLRFITYFKYILLYHFMIAMYYKRRYQKPIFAKCLQVDRYLLQILFNFKSISSLASVYQLISISWFPISTLPQSPISVGHYLHIMIFHNLLRSFKIWCRWRQRATSVHLLPPTLIFFRFKLEADL